MSLHERNVRYTDLSCTLVMDANASTSRLLTQLILKPTDPSPESLKVDLSPALPSIGEALAVLSGCTLLLSMLDTPFVMFWVRFPFSSTSSFLVTQISYICLGVFQKSHVLTPDLELLSTYAR
jgi:hypothetical protein